MRAHAGCTGTGSGCGHTVHPQNPVGLDTGLNAACSGQPGATQPHFKRPGDPAGRCWLPSLLNQIAVLLSSSSVVARTMGPSGREMGLKDICRSEGFKLHHLSIPSFHLISSALETLQADAGCSCPPL